MVWIGGVMTPQVSVYFLEAQCIPIENIMTWIINIVRITMSMVIADIDGSSMDLYLPNNNF